MRWNPWRDLRSREHLRLEWASLAESTGGAMWEGDRIILDPRLNQTRRNAALGHELVHEERGIGWPVASAATMQREEAIVRAITAERLVPVAELAAMAVIDRLDGWTLAEIAAEFNVPEDVAAISVRRVQVELLERELERCRGERGDEGVSSDSADDRGDSVRRCGRMGCQFEPARKD